MSRPVLLTVGGGGVVVWLASRQEIPYTHRRHAVLISQETEKSLGIQAFEQVPRLARCGSWCPAALTLTAAGQIKASAQGKVLPPSAPASQLVRRIGTRIAKAAAEGSGSGYLEHMKASRAGHACWARCIGPHRGQRAGARLGIPCDR